MRSSLVEKLCCPIDKHDLDIRVFVKHEDGEIIEALMTCPECRRYFPVVYGIPIMTPDEFRDRQIEAPTLQRWQETFELEEDLTDTFLLEGKD